MRRLNRLLALMVMMVAVVLGAPSTVAAEEERAPEVSEEAAQEEAAPEASPQRSGLPEAERRMPGGNLVVISYLILWAMVAGFLLHLWRRQRGLQEEIDDLEGRLDKWTEVDG